MEVYVLILDGENIGVYDEYIKAYDNGMSLTGGIEEDFEIETFDIE